MKQRESDFSLLALAIIALVVAFALGSNGILITLAQISPQPTPTFTPTPAITPVPPTYTPTNTLIPPTPTFTPLPPTPTPIPNAPPICANAYPSVDTLWPPNHRFVGVDVLGVTDPEGGSIVITIDSIFQDEPVDSYGDGSFTPDGHGVGTSSAEVRTERIDTGNGRAYHIRFTANDAYGGSCSGEVLVSVPKDRGRNGDPVDDGGLFDSTAVFP